MNCANEQPRHRALDLFCAEPYRLFFPLGLLWAMVGSWHWLAFHLQLTTDYGPLYHGLMQMLSFGGCFAAGFLMTALPNFLAAPKARPWELGLAVLLVMATGGALFVNALRPALMIFFALLVHLDVFTLRRFLIRQGEPPPFMYIAWGLAHGTIALPLMLFPISGFPRLGERMLEQGLLLSLVLGIGSFLGARLMGTFQPPAFLFRQKPGTRPVPPPLKMRKIFALGGLLLFVSFLLEAKFPLAGKLLRAMTVSAQLLVFGNIHRRPQSSFLSVRLLWLSFWFLVVGFWMAALLPRYEIGALHIAFIGGFGLMILAMGLRVVASHGGVAGLWEGAAWQLKLAALSVLIAVPLRFAAAFFPTRYTLLLALAAGCWIVALLAWGALTVPRVGPSHRGG